MDSRIMADLKLQETGDEAAIALRKTRRAYEATALITIPAGPWDLDLDLMPELGHSCKLFLDEGYQAIIWRCWNLSWDVELIYGKDHWINSVDLCKETITPYAISRQEDDRLIFNTSSENDASSYQTEENYIDLYEAEQMAIRMMEWLKEN